MGKIYDLTAEDIHHVINQIIDDNTDLKNWCQKDDSAKILLENIFYIKDIDTAGKEFVNDKNGYYGIAPKASLYRKDTKQHICAKDMVIDFIKIIFSPETWRCIKTLYCKIKNIETKDFIYADMYIIITKLKEAIVNNIVKLTDYNFCYYLQIITHFREHTLTSMEEILEWLPDFEMECCWNTTDWKCPYCESGKCTLKGKENYVLLIQQQLENMAADKILLPVIDKSNTYKINY